jgi:hypothetical protein
MERPLSVTILGCLYIVVGAAGFAFHLQDFQSGSAYRYDAVGIELIQLLAIVCGAFMLRGRNWARWVAIGWIALHVVVSVFHTFGELAVHLVFCAAITWLLLRADAARYFRGGGRPPQTASAA